MFIDDRRRTFSDISTLDLSRIEIAYIFTINFSIIIIHTTLSHLPINTHHNAHIKILFFLTYTKILNEIEQKIIDSMKILMKCFSD